MEKIRSGGIFVEYFFLLSGYFAMRNMKQNKCSIQDNSSAQYSFKYAIKKIIHILPYVIIGTVMYYIVVILMNHYDFQHILYLFLQLPLELLQMSMTGATGITFNYPIWYLSALMIALPLVMYCFFRNTDFFESYMITIVPMLIYGWMNNTYHTIGLWHEWTGIIHAASIRAFADLLLGCLVYKFSMKLKSLTIMELGKGILTLFEIVGFGAVCIVSFKPRGGYSFQVAVLLMILSLSITFSGKSWTACLNSKLRNSFCRILGELSIIVFCIHASVLKFVECCFPLRSYIIKVLFSFVIIFFISGVILFLKNRIKKILVN